MNISDMELFKKSKIIKIGSVEKKLQPREVGAFWKKSGNAGIFVPVIWSFGSETVPECAELWKILESQNFVTTSSSLSFYVIGIIFGIWKLNIKLCAEKFLDFRFFDFFSDFRRILDENHWKYSCQCWQFHFRAFFNGYHQKYFQNQRKNQKIENQKKNNVKIY